MKAKTAKGTIETEGFYKETPQGIYYYWRVIGLPTWNVQLTGLKKLPTINFKPPKDTKD